MRYLKDPKTGKPSATLTILMATVTTCLLKLLVSGVVIMGYHLPLFSASEFAIALSAAGGLYWGRKHTDVKKDKSTKE